MAAKWGRAWDLVSDHPAMAPEPWPADAAMVSEMVWVAQTSVELQRR